MRMLAQLAIVGVLACGAFACAGETGDATSDDTQAFTGGTRAKQLLYGSSKAPAQCLTGADADQTRCLIRARYASDPAARDLALDLFDTNGGVAGVLPEQDFDGGYRGIIHFVPQLPVSSYRKHIGYARDAMREIDTFFAALQSAAHAPIRYRHQSIDLRFFRSVGRTTPSAFTEGDWTLSYNVVGTLVASEPLVRETLVHEMFHMNDWAHADWSYVLAPNVNSIVARCGTSTTCLAPYTPTNTKVSGGTYYAFQPNNGTMVFEYAAELAVRYYAEQSAAMRREAYGAAPFKCGPAENGQAWALIRDMFFGGADLVPACN